MDDLCILFFFVLYIVVAIGSIASGVNIIFALLWPLVVIVVLAILAFVI